MAHNTITEMKAVLEAIEQGRPIQAQTVNTDRPDEWDNNTSNTPNFFEFRYRVKPEKKWRPFKDAKEMILASNSPSYSVYVKRKERKETLLISGFNDNEVYITTYGWRNVESLLEYYTFADGRPCGVEEEA